MRAAVALMLLVLAVAAPAAAAEPARIAFGSGEQGIDVMNADGSGRTPLLRVRHGLFASQPAWSPDGARIAYVAGGDESGRSRIWTMAADGSDQRPVGPRRNGTTFELTPAWSPDGSMLAFTRTTFRRDSLTTSLIVAAPDGSGSRTVVSERAKRLLDFVWPAWSRDGTRLLYTRRILDRNSYFRSALYSVASDGSDRRLIARDAAGASFSPDGSTIAFSSTRDRNGHTCGSDECFYHGEIYTAAADGSAPRRLTRSKGDDEGATWSPDGARIAFDSDRNYPRGFSGETDEIYSIAPDGSCLTWLTNGTAGSFGPAWEPGAGRSSDPGACGDAGRPPLIETDLAPARMFTETTPYWLGGETSSHLLLSDVRVELRSLTFAYEDCSRFRPSECGRPTYVYADAVCANPRGLYHELARSRTRRFRVGLLLRPPEQHATKFLVTGTTVVGVSARPAETMDVFRALRPFDSTEVATSFPRATLPRSIWQTTARVQRAYRRHDKNVKATARALGTHTTTIADALKVARKLHRLGPFDRADC